MTEKRDEKTEQEKSVIVDGYFNVRNLKFFYSPIGPGIKHLSTEGATVMADRKRPVSYIIYFTVFFT